MIINSFFRGVRNNFEVKHTSARFKIKLSRVSSSAGESSFGDILSVSHLEVVKCLARIDVKGRFSVSI